MARRGAPELEAARAVKVGTEAAFPSWAGDSRAFPLAGVLLCWKRSEARFSRPSLGQVRRVASEFAVAFPEWPGPVARRGASLRFGIRHRAPPTAIRRHFAIRRHLG